MHSWTNIPNNIARQTHCSHMAMALWGCPRNSAQPGDSCHPAAHPGKSGTEIRARLPPVRRTSPSPCYPILDVVEKTLGHERVLVQVDQVGRLGETNKESPWCAPLTQVLRDAPEGDGNSAAPQAASCMGSPALRSSRTTCPGMYFSRGLQRTEQLG